MEGLVQQGLARGLPDICSLGSKGLQSKLQHQRRTQCWLLSYVSCCNRVYARTIQEGGGSSLSPVERFHSVQRLELANRVELDYRRVPGTMELASKWAWQPHSQLQARVCFWPLLCGSCFHVTAIAFHLLSSHSCPRRAGGHCFRTKLDSQDRNSPGASANSAPVSPNLSSPTWPAMYPDLWLPNTKAWPVLIWRWFPIHNCPPPTYMHTHTYAHIHVHTHTWPPRKMPQLLRKGKCTCFSNVRARKKSKSRLA